MFAAVRGNIFQPVGSTSNVQGRLTHLDTVGYKACGLALLPPNWTPPFLVLSSEVYRQWSRSTEDQRQELLQQSAYDLEISLAGWIENWPHGLAFRSSATSETLRDRGAYQSIELTADYGAATICRAITDIYASFAELQSDGAIAIVVQAKVHAADRGHLSNERRVSKTVNQWMWEQEPSNTEGRFNSQRSTPPSAQTRLALKSGQPISNLLQQVGRWCTSLQLGPMHLEWGVSGVYLWLFQLDLEDDQPEYGFDPSVFLRAPDATPAGVPPQGSPFTIATFESDVGWPKVDKVREFIRVRPGPYPQLCFATGTEIESAIAAGRDIVSDVHSVTSNFAVCRTDCISPAIPKLNLPRTETVSAQRAFDFMKTTLSVLKAKGAKPEEVCFILHKFIPARAAAWALADPARQVVLVDALWGLPDGLQYMSHDRFEYDVKLDVLSSETLRYKPYFLQETDTGKWERVQVKRNLARHRSISLRDIREVADLTHKIAVRLNRKIQIMWFCDVADMANAGTNVPWFMLDAQTTSNDFKDHVIPEASERITITSLGQLRGATYEHCVLELEPEAELFRMDEFLDCVIAVALKGNLPVIIRGSTLSHAYYTLQREGVTVVATESPRTRIRQRQVFNKLVRDDIPDRILEKGERVTIARIAKAESRAALVIKLHEEAQELLQASNPDDVTAELADLLEVVRSLCLATGVELETVERVAEQKRAVRGSFAKNVVLLETSRASWKEKHSGEDGATISLRNLAHVEEDGTRHIANFTSVLAGEQAIIELKTGVRISIKITNKGIEINEVEPGEHTTDQLSLPF